MKSIHNYADLVYWKLTLVIAHVKIQFEINSQLPVLFGAAKETCDCSRKNTI
ncbi:hypothetical protein NH341_02395 [Tenacibaculum sp. XPcli2-G]|uniref:hypothetical protein n=1 Tax=Tenacibaculum sp. XPcli2-G TaxID=2954503 RepID=UPI002097F108|nr:hypothetical protein [Tenacibaculum sp. XPcli2-G]MCO7184261.1 hypothetical protein [Tenacibaculum sp. XPcli2-G]